MINNLLKETSYKNLTSKQAKELMQYLKDTNVEFNLTANLQCVSFNPKLPEKIYNTLSQFTLFSLMNYTFSSLIIKENSVQFEAGFGAENFGSVCTVPYNGIFQLGVNDSILFINPVATITNNCKNDSDDIQKERSMNAFKKI